MPAILNDAAEIELWLSNNGWNDKVKALVRPFEGKVECYPVDQGVGKVGNESEDFIKVSRRFLFSRASFIPAATSRRAGSPAYPFPLAADCREERLSRHPFRQTSQIPVDHFLPREARPLLLLRAQIRLDLPFLLRKTEAQLRLAPSTRCE